MHNFIFIAYFKGINFYSGYILIKKLLRKFPVVKIGQFTYSVSFEDKVYVLYACGFFHIDGFQARPITTSVTGKIHRPHHQHVLYVMNQASPDSRELIFPSGEKYCTTIGTPYPTAKPPRFAINIRVDVNFVISFVSRVSEALSAP